MTLQQQELEETKKYNELCEGLNQVWNDQPWFNKFMVDSNYRSYQWIRKNVLPSAAIIDVGAGWGTLPLRLALHGYTDLTVNEIDHTRIDHAKYLASLLNVKLKFREGSMFTLGDSEKYDVVSSVTWQHPQYPYEQVIKCLSSYLNPSGYLMLTFWNEDGNIDEARQEFLKHYTYVKGFGLPFPSIHQADIEHLYMENDLNVVHVDTSNTSPTPNMEKMQCTTPEHLIVGQK